MAPLDPTVRHGRGFSPRIVESASGLAAGFLSTIVAHPLDLIKTRLQSANPAAQLTVRH